MSNVIEVPVTASGFYPQKAHHDDAAYDMYANERVVIPSGQTKVVPCGFKTAIPEGHVGLVCSRSGLAAKSSVFVLNAPGVIDAGYRGEWCAILHNLGAMPHTIEPGDRVAQAVILELSQVCLIATSELPESKRGEGGLGSTGK